MAAAATLYNSEDPDTLVLRATGEWLVADAVELDQALRALDLPRDRRVSFDLSAIDRLDTTGALLVLRTEHDLAVRGNAVALANVRPGFERLLAQVRASGAVEPLPHPRPHHGFIGFIARIGEVLLAQLSRGYAILGFIGLVVAHVAGIWRHPRRIRPIATLVQIEQTGLDAVPIVGLLALLIGVVIAYQGADQLRRFGAEIYTVNLLAVSILRELGVLVTAIIVAGRSGSAFTAQLGTMQVNEEIDALRTIGLDPVELLVMPRILGLALSLPLLVFYADFMGLLGGCLMSWATLGISIPTFARQLQVAVTGWTLWVGVIKAPFFAALIALIGCYEGFSVRGSADSVGRQTTRSVVEGIFFIIVSDAAFSILFSLLGV